DIHGAVKSSRVKTPGRESTPQQRAAAIEPPDQYGRGERRYARSEARATADSVTTSHCDQSSVAKRSGADESSASSAGHRAPDGRMDVANATSAPTCASATANAIIRNERRAVRGQASHTSPFGFGSPRALRIPTLGGCQGSDSASRRGTA